MKFSAYRISLSAGSLVLVLFTTQISTARAQTISSYDITNAELSGFGGWSHTFTGTISPLGGGLANYTGGSGTLNDGIISTSVSNNELFINSDNSVITLYLSSLYQLTGLTIYGGVNPSNGIPGVLTGATIGFGGHTATIASLGFTPGCANGLCNDFFDFTGTSLAGFTGNTVTLSNFSTSDLNGYYSITEIGLTGTPSASGVVPEPATMSLMATGLVAMVGAGLRRRRVK